MIIFSCFRNSLSQDIYRATEGRWQKVIIDTITPLDSLIKRLDSSWKFVETGKAYWIGYTDDMYSIAQYKEIAIKPLINLINKTDSFETQIAGLYTIHLIGIDCKIAGRFIEQFIDTMARNTLITFLNDPKLSSTVLKLLMRDPWPTDIPYLIDCLSYAENDYLNILSALNRYNLDNKPFGQPIPEEILVKEIMISTNEPFTRQPIHDIIALQKEMGNKVKIDDEILKSKEWEIGEQLLNTNIVQTEKHKVGTILEFLSNSVFSYIDFDNRFFYTYLDGKITIYGPTKAREIWLKWWTENKNQT